MNQIDKMYEKEVRQYRKYQDTEKLAFEFLKHYEFYGDTNSTLKQVFNSILESTNWYSEKEKKSY